MAHAKMIIRFAKSFERQFKKLSMEHQKRADEALAVFEKDPFLPSLRNHPLKGIQEGMRSISAGHDLRLLYTEEEGHVIVLFVDVGSHNDVYR